MKLRESVLLKVVAYFALLINIVCIVIASFYIFYFYNDLASINDDKNFVNSLSFRDMISSDMHDLFRYIMYQNYFDNGEDEIELQKMMEEKRDELEKQKEEAIRAIELEKESEIESVNKMIDNNNELLEFYEKQKNLDYEDDSSAVDYDAEIAYIINEIKNQKTLKQQITQESSIEIKEINDNMVTELKEYEESFKIDTNNQKDDFNRLKFQFNIKESNFKYFIIEKETDKAYTNFNLSLSKDFFSSAIGNSIVDYKYNANIEKLIDFIYKNKLNIIFDTENYEYETNINNMNYNLNSIMSYSFIDYKYHYKVYIAINPLFEEKDKYMTSNVTYNRLARYLNLAMIVGSISVVLLFISVIYLIYSTGYKAGYEGIYLNWFDKIYSEILLMGAYGALYFAYYGIYYIYIYSELIMGICFAGFGLILALIILLGFSRRVKAGTLFSNMGVVAFCKLVRNVFCAIFGSLKSTYKIAIVFIGYNFLSIMLLLMTYETSGGSLLIYLIISILILAYLSMLGRNYKKLADGAKKIAKGDLNSKIDTEKIGRIYKELGNCINNIGEGLHIAVADRLKSERLKTDLITNVSHDIKTPLTSIINYVNLIKLKNIEDDEIKGYIKVLEDKSQRLKQLTEDIVEVSKASSGNMEINFETIDLIELIKQANAEFEEKFLDKGLEIIMNIPEEAIYIKADGRRMYRVMENIYSNVSKYAMNNTRIYIDAKDNINATYLSVKNISMNQLNIDAEELTERFIRGDIARSTEGSGLGLSIAKNLMELQGGKFEIYLDGDLFKVTIIFVKP